MVDAPLLQRHLHAHLLDTQADHLSYSPEVVGPQQFTCRRVMDSTHIDVALLMGTPFMNFVVNNIIVIVIFTLGSWSQF